MFVPSSVKTKGGERPPFEFGSAPPPLMRLRRPIALSVLARAVLFLRGKFAGGLRKASKLCS